MDKYGVKTDEKDSRTKEATEAGRCPICGLRLEGESNVPKCPGHGVAPFEPESEDTDDD